MMSQKNLLFSQKLKAVSVQNVNKSPNNLRRKKILNNNRS